MSLVVDADGGLTVVNPDGLGILLDPSAENLLRLSASGLFASGGGAWNNWTPTLVQPGAMNLSSSLGRYKVLGKMAFLRFRAIKSGTGTGTGGSPVVLGGWPAALNIDGVTGTAPGVNTSLGAGTIYDSSTVLWYAGTWLYVTTSTAAFMVGDGARAAGWGQAPSIGLATSDEIAGALMWETV